MAEAEGGTRIFYDLRVVYRMAGSKPGSDGSTNEGPRPNGEGGTMGRYEKGAWGVGGIGAVLLTVYGAIMIIPKAIGQAFFPWLPEEMRGPAVSSCSCSCCLSIALVLVLTVASKMT